MRGHKVCGLITNCSTHHLPPPVLHSNGCCTTPAHWTSFLASKCQACPHAQNAAQVQKHPMPIMHMCQQDVHRWCCRPIAFYQTHYLLTTPIADMAAGDHHDSSTPSDSSMCAWITKSASNLNETTYTHATSGPTRSFAHKPVQVQVR